MATVWSPLAITSISVVGGVLIACLVWSFILLMVFLCCRGRVNFGKRFQKVVDVNESKLPAGKNMWDEFKDGKGGWEGIKPIVLTHFDKNGIRKHRTVAKKQKNKKKK